MAAAPLSHTGAAQTGATHAGAKKLGGAPTGLAFQRCIMPGCGASYGVDEVRTSCDACGSLLDICYDWDRLPVPDKLSWFETKWARRNDPLCLSGVWRFRELLPFAPPEQVVTIGEGQTLLHRHRRRRPVRRHEARATVPAVRGDEPLGQLQGQRHDGRLHPRPHRRRQAGGLCLDRQHQRVAGPVLLRSRKLMKAVIFIGSRQDRLRQALAGARLRRADRADRRRLRRRHGSASKQVSEQLGIYLVNSVNPFRLEGQKTIMFRVLESLGWEVPDWIVVPGGNLGNSSAFGKAFHELQEAGADRSRAAAGGHQRRRGQTRCTSCTRTAACAGTTASRITRSSTGTTPSWTPQRKRADTIASAIEINRPVNLDEVPPGARVHATAWSAR